MRADIHDASHRDVGDILAIQSQKIVVPEALERGTCIEQDGFLVYPVSDQDLRQLIANPAEHIIKVAQGGGIIAGYIISYDMRQWQMLRPDWLARARIEANHVAFFQAKKMLYGRHIAIDDHTTIGSVGRDLLNATLQEGKNRGYDYFVVEVMRRPILNQRSIRFVESEGFALIGSIGDRCHRDWLLYGIDLKSWRSTD